MLGEPRRDPGERPEHRHAAGEPRRGVPPGLQRLADLRLADRRLEQLLAGVPRPVGEDRRGAVAVIADPVAAHRVDVRREQPVLAPRVEELHRERDLVLVLHERPRVHHEVRGGRRDARQVGPDLRAARLDDEPRRARRPRRLAGAVLPRAAPLDGDHLHARADAARLREEAALERARRAPRDPVEEILVDEVAAAVGGVDRDALHAFVEERAAHLRHERPRGDDLHRAAQRPRGEPTRARGRLRELVEGELAGGPAARGAVDRARRVVDRERRRGTPRGQRRRRGVPGRWREDRGAEEEERGPARHPRGRCNARSTRHLRGVPEGRGTPA